MWAGEGGSFKSGQVSTSAWHHGVLELINSELCLQQCPMQLLGCLLGGPMFLHAHM